MKWNWDKFYEKLSDWAVVNLPRIGLALIVFTIGIWLSRIFSKWLKRFFERKQVNPSLRYFLLNLIGKERVSISKRVMAGVNKAFIKIDDFETTAAELAISKKYAYVICGHIHQPQKRVIETATGTVTYLNSGDWVEHLTSLEYYQKEWKIFQYNEKDFHLSTVKDPDLPLTVITDQVSVYINSLAI